MIRAVNLFQNNNRPSGSVPTLGAKESVATGQASNFILSCFWLHILHWAPTLRGHLTVQNLSNPQQKKEYTTSCDTNYRLQLRMAGKVRFILLQGTPKLYFSHFPCSATCCRTIYAGSQESTSLELTAFPMTRYFLSYWPWTPRACSTVAGPPQDSTG